jgi:hypothetical protein
MSESHSFVISPASSLDPFRTTLLYPESDLYAFLSLLPSKTLHLNQWNPFLLSGLVVGPVASAFSAFHLDRLRMTCSHLSPVLGSADLTFYTCYFPYDDSFQISWIGKFRHVTSELQILYPNMRVGDLILLFAATPTPPLDMLKSYQKLDAYLLDHSVLLDQLCNVSLDLTQSFLLYHPGLNLLTLSLNLQPQNRITGLIRDIMDSNLSLLDLDHCRLQRDMDVVRLDTPHYQLYADMIINSNQQVVRVPGTIQFVGKTDKIHLKLNLSTLTPSELKVIQWVFLITRTNVELDPHALFSLELHLPTRSMFQMEFTFTAQVQDQVLSFPVGKDTKIAASFYTQQLVGDLPPCLRDLQFTACICRFDMDSFTVKGSLPRIPVRSNTFFREGSVIAVRIRISVIEATFDGALVIKDDNEEFALIGLRGENTNAWMLEGAHEEFELEWLLPDLPTRYRKRVQTTLQFEALRLMTIKYELLTHEYRIEFACRIRKKNIGGIKGVYIRKERKLEVRFTSQKGNLRNVWESPEIQISEDGKLAIYELEI